MTDLILVDVKTAAQALGLKSTSTLYKWHLRRKYVGGMYKVGSRLRFDIAKLRELMQEEAAR